MPSAFHPGHYGSSAVKVHNGRGYGSQFFRGPPPPAPPPPPSAAREGCTHSRSMSSPPVPGGSTRKRRCTPDPGSRWASLHQDLVDLVASRLLAGDLLDYIRFRAVCTGWRSGTASPRGCGVADPRFHPRRWMMFPEGHFLYPGRPELRGYVRFLNLDTGTFVRVNIPLLGNHHAIESIDGLLLLMRGPDPEGTVRLLNPFTGDITEFPPIGTLLRQLGYSNYREPYSRRLQRDAYASISFNSGAITIMLALSLPHRLAYATSLDRQWTLASWECPRMVCAPLSFQGKLYIIHTPMSYDDDGKEVHQVLEIDPPVQDGAGTGHEVQPPKLIATIPAHKLIYPSGLVQCGSEILVLGHADLFTPLLVCKLTDLVLQRFTPIKNIGGNTLFLAQRNISVSSKILPTVKGDSVIYIRPGQPYLVQYHLSSGTVSPAIDKCNLFGHAPGPSSLVHHIFSCCIRNLWYRGLLFRRIGPLVWVEDKEDVENVAGPSYVVFYINMWFISLRLEFANSYAAHKCLFFTLIHIHTTN